MSQIFFDYVIVKTCIKRNRKVRCKVKLGVTNSVVNEISVITNTFLSHIGQFSTQKNYKVITNKNGRSRAVRSGFTVLAY